MKGFLQFWDQASRGTRTVVAVGGLALISAVVMAVVVMVLTARDNNISGRDAAVTNLTDSAFTVTWISDTPYAGAIAYKEGNGDWGSFFAQSGSNTAQDDRDVELNSSNKLVTVEGGAKDRHTHHVTVRDLKPDTEYSFRIAGSINGKSLEISSVKTKKLIEDIKTPNPGYGKVDGVDANDSFILMFSKLADDASSVLISTPISTNSTYSVDLNPFNLTLVSAKNLVAKVYTQTENVANFNYTKDDYKPFETIKLEKTADTSSQITSPLVKGVSAQAAGDKSNLVTTPESASDCNGITCGGNGQCFGGKSKNGGYFCGCQYQDGSVEFGPFSTVGFSGGTFQSGTCEEKPGTKLVTTNITSGETTPPTQVPVPTTTPVTSGACQNIPTEASMPLCKGMKNTVKTDQYVWCDSIEGSAIGPGCYYLGAAPDANPACANISSASNSCANARSYTNIVATIQAKGPTTGETKTASSPAVDSPEAKHYMASKGGMCINVSASPSVQADLEQRGFSVKEGFCPVDPQKLSYTIQGLSTNAINGILTTAKNAGANTADASVEVVALIQKGISVTGVIFTIPQAIGEKVANAMEEVRRKTGLTENQVRKLTLTFRGGGGVSPSVTDMFTARIAARKVLAKGAAAVQAFLEYLVSESIKLSLPQVTSGLEERATEAVPVAPDDGVTVNEQTTPAQVFFSFKNSLGVCEAPGIVMTNLSVMYQQCSTAVTTGGVSCGVANGLTYFREAALNVTTNCQFSNPVPPTPTPAPVTPTTPVTLPNQNQVTQVAPKVSAQGVTPGSRQAVLGAATADLSATETGRYVFFRDGQLIAEQDIVVNDGAVDVKLFTDANGNGQKDANEPYFTDYSTIEMKKDASVKSYDLNAGWNLIHIPMIDTRTEKAVKTADDLIAYWNEQGADIKHVARFKGGKFELYGKRESGTTYSPDFNLIPGEGLFVFNSSTNNTVTFSGNEFDQSFPIQISNGWNLLGVISPDTDYTSESFLKKLNEQGVQADTISQLQNGTYQSVISEEGTTFGNNFNVIDSRGYFVKVVSGGGKTVTP